jgi:hypothetical protein
VYHDLKRIYIADAFHTYAHWSTNSCWLRVQTDKDLEPNGDLFNTLYTSTPFLIWSLSTHIMSSIVCCADSAQDMQYTYNVATWIDSSRRADEL